MVSWWGGNGAARVMYRVLAPGIPRCAGAVMGGNGAARVMYRVLAPGR